MLGNTYDTQVCSIARALELVGERWTLLILRNALFAGSTRYRDFQGDLGIATNVLQDRLDGLVDGGIMERRPSAAQAGVTEYLLTKKGRDFAPALIALSQWGDKWAAPDGAPMIVTHRDCGHETTPTTVCSHCGEPLTWGHTRVASGPGRTSIA